MVMFGTSITCVGLTSARMRTALVLRNEPPPRTVLHKLKSVREGLHSAAQFKASAADGFVDLLVEIRSNMRRRNNRVAPDDATTSASP